MRVAAEMHLRGGGAHDPDDINRKTAVQHRTVDSRNIFDDRLPVSGSGINELTHATHHCFRTPTTCAVPARQYMRLKWKEKIRTGCALRPVAVAGVEKTRMCAMSALPLRLIAYSASSSPSRTSACCLRYISCHSMEVPSPLSAPQQSRAAFSLTRPTLSAAAAVHPLDQTSFQLKIPDHRSDNGHVLSRPDYADFQADIPAKHSSPPSREEKKCANIQHTKQEKNADEIHPGST